MRAAFLGTGLMGAPMVRRLAAASIPVAAWNRTASRAAALVADGIEVVPTARDAVSGASVVFIMLSTGPVVDEVLFGADGVATALAAGVTVVVMSSIPVESARAQAALLARQGVHYVDAPVSGGVHGAVSGSLTIMAGGDPDRLRALAPLFAPLGRVTRVGPVGAGQLAKLANQIIVGVTIGAVAEALLFAARGGADPKAVREALLGGFADSRILREHGARMLDRNFAPGGRASTQLKDLATAREAADRLGLTLPLTALAERLYAGLCALGQADLDHSALYLALESGTLASVAETPPPAH